MTATLSAMAVATAPGRADAATIGLRVGAENRFVAESVSEILGPADDPDAMTEGKP